LTHNKLKLNTFFSTKKKQKLRDLYFQHKQNISKIKSKSYRVKIKNSLICRVGQSMIIFVVQAIPLLVVLMRHVVQHFITKTFILNTTPQTLSTDP